MEETTFASPTLYVDLDGTFTKSDLLFESLIIAIKQNPLVIFLCFFWLLKSKAYLKYQLSLIAEVQTKLLPLNPEFHAFLLEEKAKKRTIILATASHEKFAKSICENYSVFDSYISSDKNTNLKGKTKLLKILEQDEKFSYAGNSEEDFIIFKECEESFLVNPTTKAKKMSLNAPTTRVFDMPSSTFILLLKQLRVHQWVKNALIFVPLMVSGLFQNEFSILASIVGFISFSLLASSTYIINDLLDLESDRIHPRKKNRPLASGLISLISGKLISILLFVLAFSLSFALSNTFTLVLLAYLMLTLAYSLKIKQYIGMDVITLASLYTIRIIAGAALLGITISFWLLSFSMFVFLSLALVKRCSELKSLIIQEKNRTSGRDYTVEDYPILLSIGSSSAMLSILMFCFYINSNVLTNQYQEPTLLWLAVPALCYWMIRMWVKTNRGEMHDDPIVFSLKDRGSIITICFMGLISLLAQIL